MGVRAARVPRGGRRPGGRVDDDDDSRSGGGGGRASRAHLSELPVLTLAQFLERDVLLRVAVVVLANGPVAPLVQLREPAVGVAPAATRPHDDRSFRSECSAAREVGAGEARRRGETREESRRLHRGTCVRDGRSRGGGSDGWEGAASDDASVPAVAFPESAPEGRHCSIASNERGRDYRSCSKSRSCMRFSLRKTKCALPIRRFSV